MDSLAHALELFNRKERNLLIREVLGHEVEPLKLSEPFRAKVARAVHIDCIPSKAWWATDYHLEWLAGALAVYTEGREVAVAKGARPNPKETNERTESRRLVEGNQEDIDLIIASGSDLILVEVKGVGAWSNQQLKSKLARLRLISDYCSSVVKPGDRKTVRIHRLLMSPRCPKKVNEEDWPAWIPLSSWPTETLEVGRCDSKGKRAPQPDNWRVIESACKSRQTT